MFMTIRHGERADFLPKPVPIKRMHDPHLTQTGKKQARATGKYLKKFIPENISHPNIHVFSSPFLRVLQTAAEIVKEIGPQNIVGGKLIVSNSICEILQKYYYSENPLPKLTIHQQPQEQMSEILGIPYSLQELHLMGTPYFPEPDAYQRFEKNLKKFFQRFYGQKAAEESKEGEIKNNVVILVSHGLSFASFAQAFYDKSYAGGYPYCGISAIAPTFSSKGQTKGFKHVLRTFTSHLHQPSK